MNDAQMRLQKPSTLYERYMAEIIAEDRARAEYIDVLSILCRFALRPLPDLDRQRPVVAGP